MIRPILKLSILLKYLICVYVVGRSILPYEVFKLKCCYRDSLIALETAAGLKRTFLVRAPNYVVDLGTDILLWVIFFLS